MFVHALTHPHAHALLHTAAFIHKNSDTVSLLISPRWLRLHLYLPLFVICLLYYDPPLSLASLVPRSVGLLFTLGLPDMISMKTCSGGHALSVLPGTLIV